MVNILSKGEKVLEEVHNITREEREALDGLRKAEKIMVLPADLSTSTLILCKLMQLITQSYLNLLFTISITP